MNNELLISPNSVNHQANPSYQQSPPSIGEMLSGTKAFYHQVDYLKATKNDLSIKGFLPVSYTWNTEHKIITIAKQIFAIIFFPIGIYFLIQVLAAKFAILPASGSYYCNHRFPSMYPDNLNLNSEWKYKRLTIQVNNNRVDVVIMGKEATLNNGRWMLASNGNGEFYQDKLISPHFKHLLQATKSNVAVFNYPSVPSGIYGADRSMFDLSNLPNRQAMTKAYRAVLSFLEDKKQGIGAKEIICYGHSIGAGIQDAIKEHDLKVKEGIKYVLVKDRTFSDLSTIASSLVHQVLRFIVKFFGWNINPAESSKRLNVPEIILQTASVNKNYEVLHDSSKIMDDLLIPAEASLAKALLDDPECSKANKVFIGMKELHNDPIENPSILAQKIETFLT